MKVLLLIIAVFLLGILWTIKRETGLEKKYKWLLSLNAVALIIFILFIVFLPSLPEEQPKPSIKQGELALLWGERQGKVVVPLITIWKYSPCSKPWPVEKYTGEWILTTAPHKTEVLMLAKEEKEGKLCYKVELPEGKIIGWVDSILLKLK